MTAVNRTVVCVRLRPLISNDQNALHQVGKQPAICLQCGADGQSIQMNRDLYEKKQYKFDHVCGPGFSNEEIYKLTFKGTVKSVMKKGFNGSAIAYGQTGTGKTLTILGNRKTPGFIQLAASDIFEWIESRKTQGLVTNVISSCYQLYAEHIFDLLATTSLELMRPLNIREDPVHGAFIEHITYVPTSDKEQLLEIVSRGFANRVTKRTGQNITSSRSHAILRLFIDFEVHDDVDYFHQSGGTENPATLRDLDTGMSKHSQLTSSEDPDEHGKYSEYVHQGYHISFRPFQAKEIISNATSIVDKIAEDAEKKEVKFRRSILTFVDLAGSERIQKSHCTGQQLKEATAINKSISTLGLCIQALSKGSSHVPFRDSKLTRLLAESLSGNALTVVIACVGPSSVNAEETQSTLQFALRAMRVTREVQRSSAIVVKKPLECLSPTLATMNQLAASQPPAASPSKPAVPINANNANKILVGSKFVADPISAGLEQRESLTKSAKSATQPTDNIDETVSGGGGVEVGQSLQQSDLRSTPSQRGFLWEPTSYLSSSTLWDPLPTATAAARDSSSAPADQASVSVEKAPPVGRRFALTEFLSLGSQYQQQQQQSYVVGEKSQRNGVGVWEWEGNTNLDIPTGERRGHGDVPEGLYGDDTELEDCGDGHVDEGDVDQRQSAAPSTDLDLFEPSSPEANDTNSIIKGRAGVRASTAALAMMDVSGDGALITGGWPLKCGSTSPANIRRYMLHDYGARGQGQGLGPANTTPRTRRFSSRSWADSAGAGHSARGDSQYGGADDRTHTGNFPYESPLPQPQRVTHLLLSASPQPRPALSRQAAAASFEFERNRQWTMAQSPHSPSFSEDGGGGDQLSSSWMSKDSLSRSPVPTPVPAAAATLQTGTSADGEQFQDLLYLLNEKDREIALLKKQLKTASRK